jgi:ABC-type transport system involved in multi-copper enzyme maturation permease subunit
VTGLKASFLAELRDLLHQPLVWIGIAAAGFAAWVFGTYDPVKANGYVVFEGALQPAAKVSIFFLLGIAAASVATERTRGTVRWILPRPISRAGFVLGKACALSVLALVFLAVAVFGSWLVAQGHDFGDVVAEAHSDEGFSFIEEEEVPPEFQAATMRKRTLIAALMLLPALLTATSIGLLVSCLVPSAAGAVIVAVGIALPVTYLPEVIGLRPETARVLPFRAAADYLDQLREFGRHLATAEWPAYGAGGAVGAFVAVFLLPLAAALVFSRLDLTD